VQTLFYRWQHRFQRYGLDGLHPRRRRATPEPAPQLPPAVEQRVLAVVIAGTTWGAQRLAAYVQRLRRLRIVATTAQRLLRRHGLATRGQRLLVLEHHSARRIGLLTECARQAMWRLRNGRTRHVAAAQPAELVCLDTFYIDQLKMVGKVWQACHAASSFGIARILLALSPTLASIFFGAVGAAS
jgi:Homeodomain-like domain